MESLEQEPTHCLHTIHVTEDDNVTSSSESETEPETDFLLGTPRSQTSDELSYVASPRSNLLWDHGYDVSNSERELEWKKFNKTDDDKIEADKNAIAALNITKLKMANITISNENVELEQTESPRSLQMLPDLIPSSIAYTAEDDDDAIFIQSQSSTDSSPRTPPPLPVSEPPYELAPPLPGTSPPTLLSETLELSSESIGVYFDSPDIQTETQILHSESNINENLVLPSESIVDDCEDPENGLCQNIDTHSLNHKNSYDPAHAEVNQDTGDRTNHNYDIGEVNDDVLNCEDNYVARTYRINVEQQQAPQPDTEISFDSLLSSLDINDTQDLTVEQMEDVEAEFESILQLLDMGYKQDSYVERFAERRDKYGFLLSPVIEAPSPTPSSLSGYSGISCSSPDPLGNFRMSPCPISQRPDTNLASLAIHSSDWETVDQESTLPIYQTVQAKKIIIVPEGYGWDSEDDLLSSCGSGEWDQFTNGLSSPPVSTSSVNLTQFGTHVTGWKRPDAVIIEESEGEDSDDTVEENNRDKHEDKQYDSDVTIEGDEDYTVNINDHVDLNTPNYSEYNATIQNSQHDDSPMKTTYDLDEKSICESNDIDEDETQNEYILNLQPCINTESTSVDETTDDIQRTSPFDLIDEIENPHRHVSQNLTEIMNPINADNISVRVITTSPDVATQAQLESELQASDGDEESIDNSEEADDIDESSGHSPCINDAEDEYSDSEDQLETAEQNVDTDVYHTPIDTSLNKESIASRSVNGGENVLVKELISPRSARLILGSMYPGDNDSSYSSTSSEDTEDSSCDDDDDDRSNDPYMSSYGSSVCVRQYTSDDSNSGNSDSKLSDPSKKQKLVSFRTEASRFKHETDNVKTDKVRLEKTSTPTLFIHSPLDFSIFGSSLKKVNKSDGVKSPRVFGRYYDEMDQEVIEEVTRKTPDNLESDNMLDRAEESMSYTPTHPDIQQQESLEDLDNSFTNIVFSRPSSNIELVKDSEVPKNDNNLSNDSELQLNLISENINENESPPGTIKLHNDKPCTRDNNQIQMKQKNFDNEDTSFVSYKTSDEQSKETLNKNILKSKQLSPVKIKVAHLKREGSTRNKIKRGFVQQLSEIFSKKDCEEPEVIHVAKTVQPKRNESPKFLTPKDNIVIEKRRASLILDADTFGEINGDSFGFVVSQLEPVETFERNSPTEYQDVSDIEDDSDTQNSDLELYEETLRQFEDETEGNLDSSKSNSSGETTPNEFVIASKINSSSEPAPNDETKGEASYLDDDNQQEYDVCDSDHSDIEHIDYEIVEENNNTCNGIICEKLKIESVDTEQLETITVVDNNDEHFNSNRLDHTSEHLNGTELVGKPVEVSINEPGNDKFDQSSEKIENTEESKSLQNVDKEHKEKPVDLTQFLEIADVAKLPKTTPNTSAAPVKPCEKYDAKRNLLDIISRITVTTASKRRQNITNESIETDDGKTDKNVKNEIPEVECCSSTVPSLVDLPSDLTEKDNPIPNDLSQFANTQSEVTVQEDSILGTKHDDSAHTQRSVSDSKYTFKQPTSFREAALNPRSRVNADHYIQLQRSASALEYSSDNTIRYPASLSRRLYGPYTRRRKENLTSFAPPPTYAKEVLPDCFRNINKNFTRETTSPTLHETAIVHGEYTTIATEPLQLYSNFDNRENQRLVSTKHIPTAQLKTSHIQSFNQPNGEMRSPKVKDETSFRYTDSNQNTEHETNIDTLMYVNGQCKSNSDNNTSNLGDEVDIEGQVVNPDIVKHTCYSVKVPFSSLAQHESIKFNSKPIIYCKSDEALKVKQNENVFVDSNHRPAALPTDAKNDKQKFDFSSTAGYGTGNTVNTPVQTKTENSINLNVEQGVIIPQTAVKNDLDRKCLGVDIPQKIASTENTHQNETMKNDKRSSDVTTATELPSSLRINTSTLYMTESINHSPMSTGDSFTSDTVQHNDDDSSPEEDSEDSETSVEQQQTDYQHVLEDEKGHLKLWPYSDFENSEKLPVTLHKARKHINVLPVRGMSELSSSNMTVIQNAQHSTEMPENRMVQKYHSTNVMPLDNSKGGLMKTHGQSVQAVLQDDNGNLITEEDLAAVLPKIAQSIASMKDVEAEEILPGITQSVSKLKNGGNLVITTMTRKVDEIESEETSGNCSPDTSHPVINVDDLENSKIYLVQDSKGELFYVEDITSESQESAYFSSSRNTSESVSDGGSSPSFQRISTIRQLGDSGIKGSTANELITAMYQQGDVQEITENEEEWSERQYEYNLPNQRGSAPTRQYSKDKFNTSYMVEEPDTMPRGKTTTRDRVETSCEMTDGAPWVYDGGVAAQSYSQATQGVIHDEMESASAVAMANDYNMRVRNAKQSSENTGTGFTRTHEAYTIEAEAQVMPEPVVQYPIVPYQVPQIMMPLPAPPCIQLDTPSYSLVKVDVTPKKDDSVTTKVESIEHDRYPEDRPIFKTVAHIQTGEKQPPVKHEMTEKKKYRIVGSKATPTTTSVEEQETHMRFDEVDYKFSSENVEYKVSPTLQRKQFFVRNSSVVEPQTTYRSEQKLQMNNNNNSDHKHRTAIQVQDISRENNVQETVEESSYSYDEMRAKMEQSDGNMRVVRGSYLIKNNLEEDDGEFDDNLNMFDGKYTLCKDNPLYQSDEDLYRKLERDNAEHARQQQRFERDLKQDLTFETVDKFSKSKTVKREEMKPKQTISEMLMSRLSTIDSKDIRTNIDVKHHSEDIYGDPSFLHADGSSTRQDSSGSSNFDSVGEKVDLMMKEGKAYITVKVTAERITPVDLEFNVWRKNQAIVTRTIEIDLLATEQRRRLYYKVMEEPRHGGSSANYGSRYSRNETVLDGEQTLDLFTRILGAADGEGDKEDITVKTRSSNTTRPFTSGMDLLY